MNKDFSYKAAFLLLSWPPKDSHPLSQESPAMTSLFHFTIFVPKAEQPLTPQIQYFDPSRLLTS